MPRRRKFIPTERLDDMLRQIYAVAADRKIDRGGMPTVRQLAKKIGWTEGNLYKRARELGLGRPKDCGRDWSTPEINILRENAHYSHEQIRKRLKAHGYIRTVSAIRSKLKLTKFHLDTPYQSAHQVAMALGYNQTATVLNWINKGLLRARVSERHGKSYLIKDDDLRDFILANPMLIDLRKVDQLWFFEVMFPGKVGMTISQALREEKPRPEFEKAFY